MIGISVASNKEWRFVLEYYKDKIDKVYKYIFGEYFYLLINDKKVLVYKCGARKSNASASTQYMIDKFNLDKIILIGTTAGVNSNYKLLDILIPNIAIQGDCNFAEKGEPFHEKFITSINLSKYNCNESATICSFDKPLIYKEDCKIMVEHNVDIRDMESGAIANICKLNNVEIVIIKGITDFPGNYEVTDERQYLEYKENVPKVMDKILKEYLQRFI